MWPRLVASKYLKRLGSNNFVADFPSNNILPDQENTLKISNSDPEQHHSLSHGNEKTRDYKVFVSTWNLGGVAPTEDINMEDWLDTGNTFCDIYVLGFQEIVPLRASNVLGSENSEILMKWNSLIGEALNRKPEIEEHQTVNNSLGFRCVISKQMVGIFISVWVRSDHRPFIRHPSVSCVGCGIMGCLGNKGSVSVRFQLHETSFCFVCSHLASGGNEGDQKYRNSDVAEILSRTSFPRGGPHNLPRNILDHDRVIMLGDLNYRISLPEATTRALVERNEWDALLENDQLRTELMHGQLLEGWQEGKIKFAPTYKYSSNSDDYYGFVQGKTGKKRRAPAWCDRIIYFGKELKQHLYERGESKLSDHRPVKAIFTAEVKLLHTSKSIRSFFFSERFERITNHFEMSVNDSGTFLSKGRSSSLPIIT